MFALLTSPCSSLFAVQANSPDEQDSERWELLEAAVSCLNNLEPSSISSMIKEDGISKNDQQVSCATANGLFSSEPCGNRRLPLLGYFRE